MVRVKNKGDLYVHQDANWNVIGLILDTTLSATRRCRGRHAGFARSGVSRTKNRLVKVASSKDSGAVPPVVRLLLSPFGRARIPAARVMLALPMAESSRSLRSVVAEMDRVSPSQAAHRFVLTVQAA